MVSTLPRIGLFAMAASLMAAVGMGLKRLYEALNGKVMEELQKEQNKKKSK